jgi:hypothetical protein
MEGSAVSTAHSVSNIAYCQLAQKLLVAFGETIREVARLHEHQSQAVIDGDPDSTRFDDLIHMANERKHAAKYEYLSHMETHGCSNLASLVQHGTDEE